MPNINIYEVDSTVTTPEEIDTNIIYIPGYATYGPINTPTLCRNLKEFHSIFGDMPYQFKVNQPMSKLSFDAKATVDITNFAQKGEYEKSFIMAQEILNTGLSVLYERVMDDTTDINNGTAGTQTKVDLFTAFDDFDAMTPPPQPPTSQNFNDNTYYILDNTITNAYVYKLATEFDSAIASKNGYYIKNGDGKYFTIKSIYPGESGALLSGDIIFNNNDTFTISLNKISQDSNFFDSLPSSQTFALSYNTEYPLYSDIENTEIGKYIKLENINTENIDGTFKYLNNQSLSYLSQSFKLVMPINEFDIQEFTVSDMYTKLSQESFFNRFEDPNDIQVKIITTGNYPLFEYNHGTTMKNLITICAKRGNGYALIDVLTNSSRTLNPVEKNSAYWVLNDDNGDYSFLKTLKVRENIKGKSEFISKYATMFLNSGVYTINTVSGLSSIILPASFSYLYNLGMSIQNGNIDTLAIAGVNRGLCTNLLRPISTTNRLTNKIGNIYQSHDAIAINPILNEQPYGYCIEGNRTLFYNKDGLLASSFLNVRNMVCDIKTRLNAIAKRFLFENNSQVLWVNFKSQVEPVLEQYIDSGNITSYQINRVATTQRATLVVEIVLYIEYAIESFEITINLKDEYSAG